jgi:hypothetical protein
MPTGPTTSPSSTTVPLKSSSSPLIMIAA